MYRKAKKMRFANVHTPKMFWALLDAVALTVIAYAVLTHGLENWESDMQYLLPHYRPFVFAWGLGASCQFWGLILLICNQVSFLEKHDWLEAGGMAGLTIGPFLILWGMCGLHAMPDPFSLPLPSITPVSPLPIQQPDGAEIIPASHNRETETIDFQGHIIENILEIIGIVCLDISYWLPTHEGMLIEMSGYLILMCASGMLEYALVESNDDSGDGQKVTRLEIAFVWDEFALAEVAGLFLLGVVCLGHYAHHINEKRDINSRHGTPRRKGWVDKDVNSAEDEDISLLHLRVNAKQPRKDVDMIHLAHTIQVGSSARKPLLSSLKKAPVVSSSKEDEGVAR